ncbi:hypothetical protein [Bradyrhizobium sp. AUGA SZCCT0431]|uniref:hypothetical protein n=1 Tax=Bradyrhizobium sp. AUGA SZCCT0431 TaxID=2807674 RepID=UPI002898E323|nr:hypothetical protein [Bradyrhizobium sp. AUGA SZCCT0431]
MLTFFAVLLAGLFGAFAAVLATGLAIGFVTALGAGFATAFGAGAFVSVLRAEAAGAALPGADDFDFATIFRRFFLDFATALAMADDNPKREEKMRALHHFEGFRASRESPLA